MRVRHPHHGFTLIELMIVIAIVIILVTLTLPNYQGYAVHAKVTEGLSISAGLKTPLAEACQIDPTATVPTLFNIGTHVTSEYVLFADATAFTNCRSPACPASQYALR